MATIYLAGGCFWGVEKYIASIQGVTGTEVGYANGTAGSVTYEQVSSGLTGDAETVRVDYDPTVAPLPFILGLFYKAIDPTSVDRQGNDVGTQYRSGIFYSDAADLPVIQHSIAALQSTNNKPIAIQVKPLTAFTVAEEYHQDYLDKHPGGYCHIGGDLFRNAAAARPVPSDFATRPGQ
jgi:peptide methionine sulfoxide reductase msrA/msrB